MRSVLVAVGLALVATGCGDDDDGTQLVVSAASSLTESLDSCAPEFGDEEGADVKLSFAGSDELAAQIRQGAKVDVFAAANTTLPDELHGEELLDSPTAFATNELVVAVPDDSPIESVEDLADDGTKVVIGSESVPIGIYTRETLAKLPPAQEEAILANVRSNEPDVKSIVGKLTQGAADAGFVYVTDVTATGGDLRPVELPDELEPEVSYGAGVVSSSEERDLAQAFVDDLGDGLCAGALQEAGFGAPP